MIQKIKLFADGNFLPVIQHDIVEVLVPALSSQTQFLLPDVPNLRESEIVAFEVISSDDLNFSPTDGVAVASMADLKKAAITFEAYNGNQFYKNSPLTNNHYHLDTNVGSNNDWMQKQFQGQRINYPKSYITYQNGGVLPATAFKFILCIYYIKRDEIPGLIGATFKNQS